MATQWTKKFRRDAKADFRLLTEAEVISTVSENAGVPLDVAANALLELDTYENSDYFRTDDLAEWLEKNANRLGKRFAAQGRGA